MSDKARILGFNRSERREPTFYERITQKELQDSWVADVLIPVNEAPRSFWRAILQVINWHVQSLEHFTGSSSRDWENEWRWIFPNSSFSHADHYIEQLLELDDLDASVKFTAIELLLDQSSNSSSDNAGALINEAAGRARIGVRLEGERFVVVESLEIHERVVRPSLLLLSDPRLTAADAAYHKAWDRMLVDDPAGAITASATAIEEALRAGGAKGSRLRDLAASGQMPGWFSAGVREQIIKLDAFREASDAHQLGTDERPLGLLVNHLAGSLLLYLGSTGPFNVE